MAERWEKLHLTIEGDGLTPAAVPLRALTEVLIRYESLLRAAAEESGVPNAHRMSIRLTGIRKGSVGLECVAPVEILHAALPAIERRTREGTPFQSQNTERSFLRFTRTLGRFRWTFQTQPRQGRSFRIESDAESSGPPYIVGETTLYGVCLSVGGDHPQAQLRIDGQERIVRVRLSSKEQAKILAGALYGCVGVAGTARWDRVSDLVVSIDAEDVFVFQNDSPAALIGWLQHAARPGWESISDPDGFLRELRRD